MKQNGSSHNCKLFDLFDSIIILNGMKPFLDLSYESGFFVSGY